MNSEIAAFTIGEPLTRDTFIVHVEKAFTTIHGAYTIINQQFIENEAAGFTYVNREEDMGIENLRHAKLSYQPDILLEKYNARLKN
ncbi:MAG: phosphatidylglycerol lysyltransferase domain-containing protein [Petrimonas sp.]|nr:phosphatidylglycerol lysyltransferase domain-containing protein [Petrimonas sp.]